MLCVRYGTDRFRPCASNTELPILHPCASDTELPGFRPCASDTEQRISTVAKPQQYDRRELQCTEKSLLR